ncbi:MULTISPECIES: hypothetical protein [unclassified Mesorhizobium]
MSASAAKTHAMKAQRASDTNEKLDEIAKAIYELARTLSDIEGNTNRIR